MDKEVKAGNSKFMLKAVIFDFDGTIGDTLKLVIESIREAVSPFMDRELSDDEIADTFGPIEEGSILKFVDEKDYEEACKLLYDAYARLHKEITPKPFAGVVDLIKYLKSKNLIVILATGKGAKTCEISLKQYQMENLFDKVKTGSIKGGIKPQMMQEVIDEYKLSADEVIYIGDAPTDIDAARQVGVKIVSVLYGTRIEEEAVKAKNPDAICYSIEDVKKYLTSLIQEKNKYYYFVIISLEIAYFLVYFTVLWYF